MFKQYVDDKCKNICVAESYTVRRFPHAGPQPYSHVWGRVGISPPILFCFSPSLTVFVFISVFQRKRHYWRLDSKCITLFQNDTGSKYYKVRRHCLLSLLRYRELFFYSVHLLF